MNRLPTMLCALFVVGCGDAIDEPPAALDLSSPASVHSWLRDGEYVDWTAESRVLAGEHGGGRRIFFNDAAVHALASGGEHRVGSVAVRELYESDLKTPRGWALSAKTDRGWYFYETFAPNDPASINVAEHKAPGCVFCHSRAPDYVQSSWPLL